MDSNCSRSSSSNESNLTCSSSNINSSSRSTLSSSSFLSTTPTTTLSNSLKKSEHVVKKSLSSSSSSLVKEIIIVTQANHSIASGFSLIKTNDGQEYCEYFFHREKPYCTTKQMPMAIALVNDSKSKSKIDKSIQMRQQVLSSMLEFYQDLFAYVNHSMKIYIYTDLADYHFTADIHRILNKLDNNHDQLQQIKHFSPNKNFHLLTTEQRRCAATAAGNGDQKIIYKNHKLILFIERAAERLHDYKINSFKKIIGSNVKYSCIC